MGYFIIDKEIHVANVIVDGNIDDISYMCLVCLNNYGYNIVHIDGQLDNQFTIEPIIRRTSFIKRTGLGLLQTEDNNHRLYLLTGKLLYDRSFENFRRMLSEIEILTATINWGETAQGKFCYIPNDIPELEEVLMNIGFCKIKDELAKKLQWNYYRTYPNALKTIFEKFGDAGYISQMYSSFISMNTRNTMESCTSQKFGLGKASEDLRNRIIYYFDSNWFMWDSQYIYND